jgi:peptidoglycan hydrolase-like protein with peptidoglycan-binding domain
MATLTIDTEVLLKEFEFESEAEINQVEATSEIIRTRSLTPVLLSKAPGCSSAIANGLSQQLIYQMNLISPNIMVSFDDLNVQLEQAAFPFLQPAAKESLRKVIAERGQPLRITSAYRTIAQQLFLYNRRNGIGGCGLTVVALPGKSNHQSGIALDVPDYQAWRPILERHGWKWFGGNDPWHFDYVGQPCIDIRATAVEAFQQLWNKNNPGDKIAEDGQWGGQTHSRLDKSPVSGFAIAPWKDNPRTLKLTRPSLQGFDVQALQQALIKYGENISADGDFGPGTEAALKRVQEKMGLNADGVAGPETLAKLMQTEDGSTPIAAPTSEALSTETEAAEVPGNQPSSESTVETESAKNVTLKEGQASLEVLELQKILVAKGLLFCQPDGDFGPKTKAAVIAFQKQSSLAADGVAGPMTLKALGYTYQPPKRMVDTGLFTVDLVAQIFQGVPRSNLEKYLPPVLRALEKVGLGDLDMVLMALGTIRAETGSFVPISEYPSQYNTAPGGRPFGLYDTRSDLGNSAVGDGDRYKGRGFVQLTGKHNYQKFSAELGLGNRLAEDPELANDPQIAADLLALFLKSKEGCIRVALALKDYAKARKYVNGGHHGLEVFTEAFQKGLTLVKGGFSPQPSGTDRPVLQLTTPNMQGEWVSKVQSALQADGIEVIVDGVFGPGTKKAVEDFQRKYSLGADGVVGPKTYERLGI